MKTSIVSEARSAVWTDRLGMIASIGCAIHCAAMPFVIAFLPMLGLTFLADESFHKIMVFVCLSLAVIAFVPGYRRHRRWLPVVIAGFGLTLIATAAFALEGACCATCVAERNGAIAAFPVDPNVATLSTVAAGEMACTDDCCELCAKQNPNLSSFQACEPAMPDFASSILWLITPLGGLLLVSAHLVNRRFSCHCGCCHNESTD